MMEKKGQTGCYYLVSVGIMLSYYLTIPSIRKSSYKKLRMPVVISLSETFE